MKTGVIILAAGSSSRLGRPKQLIEYQGKNLIKRTIDVVLASEANFIVVVLGWNPNLIKAGIQTESVHFVENESWKEGMTASMQAGLDWYMASNNKLDTPDQILILTCDQIKVDTDLINRMIKEKEESGKGIVACKYSDTLGVPAIFDAKYFYELLELNSKDPAKKLIFRNLSDVFTIDFPLGSIDIDTEEDLQNLVD